MGKTTLAEEYAKTVGGVAVTSFPLHSLWKEGRRAVNAGTDVEARFGYFVQLNRAQMRQARKVAAEEMVVTLDTSIYRTVATHRVLGSLAAAEYEIPDELRPDVGFLLKLPDEERERRMVERDGALVHPSHWDERLYILRHRVAAAYRDSDFGLIQIDAVRPPEEIVHRIQPMVAV